MDINEILKQLDGLFDTGQPDRVEAFLNENYQKAMELKDSNAALTILNEQIGFYRVTTQYDKALQVISGIETLIADNHLENTKAHGTSLLNMATVYRAMGKLKEAQNCYQQAEQIYEKELDDNDYEMASLWNNMSLLYLEQGQYTPAVTYLQKALEVIAKKPECQIQTAVTYTNLGQAYLRLEDWQQAEGSLNAAEDIFAQFGFEDEHYSGCAVARGFLYLQKKDYGKAVDSYEKALLCVDRFYGRTANFYQIKKDLMEAYRLKGDPIYDSMLDVCQAYYERYGKPMIEQKFSDYVSQIAVGLCGEGSECLGLEDEISLDHDCGPGFSLWVTDEVYDKIGKELQEAYEKLPRVFAGHIRRDTARGKERCGVCRIDDYFTRVLGGRSIPESPEEWRTIEESALATAVSGRVFTDPEGIFSRKRERLLSYYPHNIWMERLARELLRAAQSGQYNYGRAMARQDYVTASLALAEYMKSIMQVVYLLNRTYSPYYKWQRAMMKKLTVLPEVGSIMEAIADMPSQRDAWKDFVYRGGPNPNDMIAQTIEIVAKLVVHTLQEMKLSESEDVYLEIQAQEVLKHMKDDERTDVVKMESVKETKNQLINEIISYEWTEFDLVRNEGGRASCQNDWGTFSIMRKSQYLTWTEEMLQEYLWHISQCLEKGRNLITEKYGRMMESTAPEEYEKIKDAFPVLSEERKSIMEAVIAIQVGWMEEFAKHYPKMAGNARSIHTADDHSYNTSYETYLRGELGTYSDELMKLYGRFIVNLSRENKNLAYMTMENTAKLYGYKNLDEAESKLM